MILSDDKVVKGIVTEIFEYGLIVNSDNSNILVLIPELSWTPIKSPDEKFSVGDSVKVKILSYVTEKDMYTGSIKSLDKGSNPYLALKSMLDSHLLCEIKYKTTENYVVQLPVGIQLLIPTENFNEKFIKNNSICIRLIKVDSEERNIEYEVTQIL